MQNLKIHYPSPQKFKKDLPLIKSRKIFFSGKRSLPKDTQLTIEITLPGIDSVFRVTGVVEKILTKTIDTTPPKKIEGMLIGLTEGFSEMYESLTAEINHHQEYGDLAEKPAQPKEALSWEWIQEAVTQAEVKQQAVSDKAAEEEAKDTGVSQPLPTEKKELTAAEQTKAQAAADFILNMIKAMLRSGYYDPDHPAGKEAKQGLYKDLQKSLGTANEIMISKEETKGKIDIIITGILDEPVGVQKIVGVGKAELFLPKFNEYFNRKSLLSLAIKKHITQDHFEKFVDIMCNPAADASQNAKVGDTLTKSLVENGINEISAVFMDDLIALETNLPWRVQMAIQRLAKDLKVLPLFESKSEEAIKEMKIKIIQDILRPLRHPNMLADIVINSYLIASHIEDLKVHELEKTIINSFPFEILIPTSRYIFAELDNLTGEVKTHPGNKILKRRLSALRRILKWVAKRVIQEKVPDAQKFLVRLYFNDILAYDEVPQDVKYQINTIKMSRDVKDNLSNYVQWIQNVIFADEFDVLLKCFKRVTPILIEYQAWTILHAIAAEFNEVEQDKGFFADSSGQGPSPLEQIFLNNVVGLVDAFGSEETTDRESISSLIGELGDLGINILGQILEESANKQARLAAVEIMSSLTDKARPRVREILDDHQREWSLHRNALLILGNVGNRDEDMTRLRKYLRHGDPRVRLEALKAAVELKAKDTEPLIIQGLQDRESIVQREAVNCLRNLQTLSKDSVDKLLDMLNGTPPKEKDELVEFNRKNIAVIRALAVLKNSPSRKDIETTILALVPGL